MKKLLTAEELIDFERRIADIYNTGVIKAPVHLSGGNEEQLIGIFKYIDERDWVCSTWRSHYHCLLKGVSPEQLEEDIRAGLSITLCYPEQRVITSAIVGGIIPISLGIALGIKRRGGTERVWVFIGDMTAETGIAYECQKYAENWDLPIRFRVERNKKSVGTLTREVWGKEPWCWSKGNGYDYELPWPHAGAGRWIEF